MEALARHINLTAGVRTPLPVLRMKVTGQGTCVPMGLEAMPMAGHLPAPMLMLGLPASLATAAHPPARMMSRRAVGLHSMGMPTRGTLGDTLTSRANPFTSGRSSQAVVTTTIATTSPLQTATETPLRLLHSHHPLGPMGRLLPIRVVMDSSPGTV